MDYSNYLVYILTQVSTQDVPTRSIAGLLLKNHIRVQFQKTPMNEQLDTLRASLAYVQAAIMPALSFEEAMLRRTATQVVAMIMSIVGPEHWPTGMETLTMLIGSQNPNEAEVSKESQGGQSEGSLEDENGGSEEACLLL